MSNTELSVSLFTALYFITAYFLPFILFSEDTKRVAVDGDREMDVVHRMNEGHRPWRAKKKVC